MAAVFERLSALLAQHGADMRVLRHEPTRTSQEAAAARGTSLASGAKALVCKGPSDFVLFVMPADRRLSNRLVRRALRWRRMRFATQEELFELTGLVPGSVPPFGSLFGLHTFCDEALALVERINFNAGDRSISINLPFEAWKAVEAPTMGVFAEPMLRD